MYTALLVDDEQRMLNLLELFLMPRGFRCIKTDNGIEALNILEREQISFILLDIMMPGMDGWETCKRIREFSNVPIIMLTARTDKSDIVKGLNYGADEYITKPFDEGELVARVQALLRRIPIDKADDGKIRCDQFELDLLSYTLQFLDKKVQLTLKEFNIIKSLITHPSRIYTREQILLIAWDYNAQTDIRTVDSHIRNLREKLKKNGFPIDQFIVTVWGIGYKWK